MLFVFYVLLEGGRFIRQVVIHTFISTVSLIGSDRDETLIHLILILGLFVPWGSLMDSDYFFSWGKAFLPPFFIHNSVLSLYGETLEEVEFLEGANHNFFCV